MTLLLIFGALAQEPAPEPAPADEPEFSFAPVGELVEGSGEGRADDLIYVPEMRFPLETTPAFPNSQVWGHGGLNGPGGGQCNDNNYSYPWRDNYCESRGFRMPLCPAGTGHQGQDIRPSTCERDVHWAVATVAGTIARIGSFSVTLVSDDGTQHRYLHLEPTSLAVTAGQRVEQGQRIGRVSNAFFDRDGNRVPTTTHLHYDINMNLDGRSLYVSPYTSLVRAYERLLNQTPIRCAPVPAQGRTLDDDESCAWWYGPPRYWRVQAGLGEGGSAHWTNAFDGERPGNWARFLLELEEAGRYTLTVNAPAPRNTSTAARYVIRHSGEETTVIVDQRPGGTLPLGTFDFTAGGDQWVSIFDNTGETGDNLHIVVDTLTLTREPDPPEAAAEPETPEAAATPSAPSPTTPAPASSGCGCAMGSRGGAGWPVLTLLALVSLRRRRSQ